MLVYKLMVIPTSLFHEFFTLPYTGTTASKDGLAGERNMSAEAMARMLFYFPSRHFGLQYDAQRHDGELFLIS
jgi:hypothetical protein